MLPLMMALCGSAWAQETESPSRRELGGIVIGAYNADLGFGGGGVANVAQFKPGYDPFRWRAQIALLMFAKDNGVRPVGTFQNLSIIADVPGAGRAPRWRFEGYLRRQTNAGWYGLGNAAPFDKPWLLVDPEGDPTGYADAKRRNEYGRSRIGLKAAGRMDLMGELDVYAGAAWTLNRFDVYAGSVLEDDLGGAGSVDAQARASWAKPHSLAEGAAGVYWDRRDHETAPTQGWLVDSSLRGGVGLGRSGAFWGANLTARGFVPLTAHTVFGTRLLLDSLGGDVPFYEMARHGGLVQENSPGGSRSLRGLNLMRLHGRQKALLNLELRTQVHSFSLVGQPARVGTTLFTDSGRVWSTLPGDPVLDGDAGIHTAGGGGVWLHWGDSFLLRIDAGTSTEGTGVYLDVDHMF